MKRLYLLLFLLSLAFTHTQPARAASYGPNFVAPRPSEGRLIRGSNPTIYWEAATGKRYAFPDIDTYYSWYPDFRYVKQVSDKELNKTPLVGNVTYRPGAKLLKVNGFPEVYAVTNLEELRLIPNETIAKQLYGTNWKSSIRSLPALFMSDYVFGKTIRTAGDYDVAQQYHSVRTPSDVVVHQLSAELKKPSIGIYADYPYNNNPSIIKLFARFNGTAFTGPHKMVIYDQQRKILGYCNDYQCEATVHLADNTSDQLKSYFAYAETSKKSLPIDAIGIQIPPLSAGQIYPQY